MENSILNSKFFRLVIKVLKFCNLIIFIYPSDKFKISKICVGLSILNILLNIWYHLQVVFELFDFLVSPTKVLNGLFLFYVAYGAFAKFVLLAIVFSTQKRFYNLLKMVENFVLKCLKFNFKLTYNFYKVTIIIVVDLVLLFWLYEVNKQTFFYALFEIPRSFYILIVFIIIQCLQSIENALR